MAEKKTTKKATKPKLPSEVFAVDFNRGPEYEMNLLIFSSHIFVSSLSISSASIVFVRNPLISIGVVPLITPDGGLVRMFITMFPTLIFHRFGHGF